MGHTVMCVCTVYFTAIVGCAFSSPRLGAGESQHDDTSEKEPAVEIEIKEKTTKSQFGNDQKEKTPKNVLNSTMDDTGGGNATETLRYSEKSEMNDTLEDQDHSIQKLEEELIKKMIKARHTEVIKSHILSKMRLTYPPKLRGVMPQLPMDEIQKVYFELNNDASYRGKSHYYARTVRKFIVGTDVTSECVTKKSTGCYSFDLRGRVDASEVQSVQLWIYKLFNHNDPYMQTFVISELSKAKRRRPGLRIKNIVERFDTTQKYGWVKVDITRSAMKWLLKPMLNHGIAVICKSCQRKNYRTIYSKKEDSKPFVVVTTRKSHRRQKRDVNECTGTSTECCLQHFTINFREIGWDAIAYPHSIQANYCTGRCHARDAATMNHTYLIQNFRWSSATPTEMEELMPCCSPISYRGQSVLYFDGDKLLEAFIPNIAATACGCM